MSLSNPPTLWERLSAAGRLSDRFIQGDTYSVCLTAPATSSIVEGGAKLFRNRSVLLAAADQFVSALAAIKLDGIARQIVFCLDGVSASHFPGIMSAAGIDTIMSDSEKHFAGNGVARVVCRPRVFFPHQRRGGGHATEWILLTSGTTAPPKLVFYTLSSLTAPIAEGAPSTVPVVWSTFYDIRQYGGMQIFLRALVGGGSLVLPCAWEPAGAFLTRAGLKGVTLICGTPSHWRKALMSPLAWGFTPRYVFVGRRDWFINVGGMKVYPEEVETVINRLPGVRLSRVRGQKLRKDVLAGCRSELAAHKVPAVFRFVPSLDIAETGKLARS